MGDTLSTIDYFLKKKYKPGINDQVNSSRGLLKRLKTNTDDVVSGGEGFEVHLSSRTRRNQGIGFRQENSALPAAGQLEGVKAKCGMAFLYGSIELTGPSIRAAAKDSDTFAKTLDEEVERMREGIEVYMNATSYGRGTGALGRITAPTAAPQGAGVFFAVDDAGRFEEGMVVEMFSVNATTGGAQTAGTPTISKVDPIGNRIAFLAAQNITNLDFIYRQGEHHVTNPGGTAMGLEGITDGFDGQGAVILSTFQGIVRATTPSYAGLVLDNGGTGSLVPMTLAKIQSAFDAVEIVGGAEVTSIWSHHTQRDAYLFLLTRDRRYVNYMEFDGGWKALAYTGGGRSVPWFADRHCLRNRVFGIDEKRINKYVGSDGPIDWMTEKGNILLRKAGFDAYIGTAFVYYQLGTVKPNAGFAVRELS